MQRSTTSHPISKIPVGKGSIWGRSRNGGRTGQSNLILSSLPRAPAANACCLTQSWSFVVGRCRSPHNHLPYISYFPYYPPLLHILLVCLPQQQQRHMCCLSNEKKFVKDLFLKVVGSGLLVRLLSYSLNSNTKELREKCREEEKKAVKREPPILNLLAPLPHILILVCTLSSSGTWK